LPTGNKGNNKITEHRAIFQRERQNSYVNKQTKSVNNRKTGNTAIDRCINSITNYAQVSRRGHDRMVVGFTITYAISAYYD